MGVCVRQEKTRAIATTMYAAMALLGKGVLGRRQPLSTLLNIFRDACHVIHQFSTYSS